MNGRLENELKIFQQIEEKLVDMPDYVIEWYYYLKANEQSAMTCRDYIRKITHFMSWTDAKIKGDGGTLSKISASCITKYFVSIKTHYATVNGKCTEVETSDSYKQCVWSCLNNFFGFLHKRGYIPENYLQATGIERPKNNDLERIKATRIHLTYDDFKNIMSVMDDTRYCFDRFNSRDKAMMLLFMTTGMRESALRSINVGDVDLENGVIRVVDKGRVRHEYYLDKTVVDVLTAYINDRNRMTELATEALFVSRNQERISVNGIVKIVKKYSSAGLGYEISPHKIRGGLASILYEQKKDAEFVRRVIGHSNISTTQRYIVTDNKEREEAVNLVTAMIM